MQSLQEKMTTQKYSSIKEYENSIEDQTIPKSIRYDLNKVKMINDSIKEELDNLDF